MKWCVMMKLNMRLISIGLFILFSISTVYLVCTLFLNIENEFTANFIVGYAVFLVFYVVYALTVSAFRIRKHEMKKRLYSFILYFILCSIASVSYYYFFKPTEMNYLNVFSIPIGLSFGIAFLDVLYKKEVES